MANDTQTSAKETMEDRKSRVRVYVTYVAAGYVFIGSILLVMCMTLVTIFANQYVQIVNGAKEVFTMVLPVATGIITYWFASRPQTSSSNGSEQQQASEPENREDERRSEQDNRDPSEI